MDSSPAWLLNFLPSAFLKKAFLKEDILGFQGLCGSGL